jgi:hypothetical protein
MATCIAGVAYPVSGALAETLYGIVSEGENVGFLVTIDTTTGNATLTHNTGLSSPSGLTYNAETGLLYTVEQVAPPTPETPLDRVYSINPATGFAEPLSHYMFLSLAKGLAYRPLDDFFYTAGDYGDQTPIWRVDSSTGELHSGDIPVGHVGRQYVEALAVRPSDGELFGSGGVLPRYIFRIPITNFPMINIEEDVVSIGNTDIIRGLTFHPDCTLYASDGDDLLIIKPSNGTVTTVGPFVTNVSFGPIGGIAFDATDDRCPPQPMETALVTGWQPGLSYYPYALWPYRIRDGVWVPLYPDPDDNNQWGAFGRNGSWSWPSGRYWGTYHRPRAWWGAPSRFGGARCDPASGRYCYSAPPQPYFNPWYRRSYPYRRALPPWVGYEW